MDIDLPVRLPLSVSDLMKLEISQRILEIHSNIKFNENLSRGEQSCSMRMYTETGRRADKKKLIVAFSNILNAPKISCSKRVKPTINLFYILICSK
jgi:hypothetical protein